MSIECECCINIDTKTRINLEAIAQDLSFNDYSYSEILEIVREVYDMGKT
jgi:hypothetical protein